MPNVRTPSAAQIVSIRTRVLDWYSQEHRVFPWRKKSASNFELIIAEILLQRTRAETVAAYFSTFTRTYSSWSALGGASLARLRQLFKPLGLANQKASRLHKLASEMKKRNGRFPKNREEIDQLPCIGQYIGNAIELFVWERPKPLIDVNMARILERYFRPRDLADIRDDPFLQQASAKLVNCENPQEINWAILDLGAKVCTARAPKCDICPLTRGCKKCGVIDR